ncbi:hypothetical protein AVEN_124494-1 [Araneus ventricosus]|uniref:Helitron helicase-like domain-containing protein n=1 Tax=Araneus ventricosus TaxID=182803 RepID=A0A4Y2KU47_ARAVE|nr:hypothetical protein AVEN_124494-1 [Araneus ventricosus]
MRWSMLRRDVLPKEIVTQLQFYAYRLSVRSGFPLLHSSGKLFQQYVVDAYVKTEGSRLNYIRLNQKDLKVELYRGLFDALTTRASNNLRVGKLIILPSFRGSPRSMKLNYKEVIFPPTPIINNPTHQIDSSLPNLLGVVLPPTPIIHNSNSTITQEINSSAPLQPATAGSSNQVKSSQKSKKQSIACDVPGCKEVRKNRKGMHLHKLHFHKIPIHKPYHPSLSQPSQDLKNLLMGYQIKRANP